MRTIQDWKTEFLNVGLGHHWQEFESLLKHEVRITPSLTDEATIAKGQSKIGGHPDLPKDQTWFKEDNGKSLSFLAQLNFSEISPFDNSGQLPESGMIYFFYSAEQDAWGFDPNDKDKFKVFYYDGNLSDIQRLDFPSDLEVFARYKSCSIKFTSCTSMPNWEISSVRRILSNKESDLYIDLSEDGEINKLLGHSDNIQGPMEEECQLVTNNINAGGPEGYKNPRAKELLKDADQWTLLFQIDSIENAGMMWGDVGRIYFWIKKEDLLRRHFEHAWFSLQCS